MDEQGQGELHVSWFPFDGTGLEAGQLTDVAEGFIVKHRMETSDDGGHLDFSLFVDGELYNDSLLCLVGGQAVGVCFGEEFLQSRLHVGIPILFPLPFPTGVFGHCFVMDKYVLLRHGHVTQAYQEKECNDELFHSRIY